MPRRFTDTHPLDGSLETIPTRLLEEIHQLAFGLDATRQTPAPAAQRSVFSAFENLLAFGAPCIRKTLEYEYRLLSPF